MAVSPAMSPPVTGRPPDEPPAVAATTAAGAAVATAGATLVCSFGRTLAASPVGALTSAFGSTSPDGHGTEQPLPGRSSATAVPTVSASPSAATLTPRAMRFLLMVTPFRDDPDRFVPRSTGLNLPDSP